MAQATAIRLTGDDLRIDDVWAVAHGAASAALSDEARTKMRAARDLVERAAHGSREPRREADVRNLAQFVGARAKRARYFWTTWPRISSV